MKQARLSNESRPPFTHDLARLARHAGLHLTEDQLDLLDLMTSFNIKTRYPDYTFELYKKCTKSYTDSILDDLEDYRSWMLHSVLPKP